MRIHRAYKVELDPNNKQRTLFLMASGVCRFVFNWGLRKRIEAKEAGEKSPSVFDQCRQLNTVKGEQFPWMLDVSKHVLESALRDLGRAFDSFFSGLKTGKRAGYPRFKSRKRGIGGFRLREDISVENNRIRLPRIGWVRLKEHGYIPTGAKINSATVSERAGRWFVSVQVETEIAVPDNQGPAIGLDLGLTSLVTCSDGRKWAAPKPLVRSLEKLRRLSRQHSRKRKGSENRKKSARKLARLHYRIACQRADYLHKLTTPLVCGHAAVVVESLNVNGMQKNKHLARGIGDAGWAELVGQLTYKAKWYGSQLAEADRWFPSTKTCSGCGIIKESVRLEDRTYRCESCGLEIDRDVNAAKNLLNLHTAGSAGINAFRDGALAPSGKKEPSTATCG